MCMSTSTFCTPWSMILLFSLSTGFKPLHQNFYILKMLFLIFLSPLQSFSKIVPVSIVHISLELLLSLLLLLLFLHLWFFTTAIIFLLNQWHIFRLEISFRGYFDAEFIKYELYFTVSCLNVSCHIILLTVFLNLEKSVF